LLIHIAELGNAYLQLREIVPSKDFRVKAIMIEENNSALSL